MKENSGERRKEIIDDIVMQHVTGIETLGAAIRRLRLEVTGLDQETFAVMCSMSTKALYQIEKDKGNPTINTLETILRKFGLRLGLTKAATNLYSPPLVPSRRASPVIIKSRIAPGTGLRTACKSSSTNCAPASAATTASASP